MTFETFLGLAAFLCALTLLTMWWRDGDGPDQPA